MEIVRLNTLKPFARREYGRISSVYDTMRGVNARLTRDFVSGIATHHANCHLLVERVEKEDERDDSMRGGLRPMERVLCGADRLEREEHEHASSRGEEQEPTTPAFDLEGCEHSPEQVPDGENTGNEELDGGVGYADGVEDLVQIVGDETVSGPLREPSDGDDDDHALAVALSRDEGLPADVFRVWQIMSVTMLRKF